MTKGEELARQLVDCNMTTMMGGRYYFVPYSLARDIVEALKDCNESKTGKWILVPKHSIDGEHPSYDNLKCSCCGSVGVFDFKHCPNCGAKMEGAKE